MVIGNPILIGGGSGGFSPSDEGKVVNNGQLVAQGSHTITENGTYDTTLISRLVANISGGGGIQTGTTPPTSDIGSNGDYYKRTIPIMSNVNYVEYLQSSGTQYIDTGIIANELTDITADVGWIQNDYVIGKRTGGASGMTNALYIGAGDSRSFAICKTGSSSVSFDSMRITAPSNGRIVCKTRSWEDDGFLMVSYYEGLGVSSLLKRVTSLNTTYSQILFGAHIDSTISKGTCRIYRVVYYQAGSPIADYLPCLDTNGVACMWDNIAQEYVYNGGTGSFEYGSAATPDELDSVLYVKENGTWRVVE